MKRLVTSGLAALLASSAFAHVGHTQGGPSKAPGPLITDRPDQTESSVTVEPGLVQLEVGWSLVEHDDGRDRIRTHTVPGLLARIGLVGNLEARVGFAGWQAMRLTTAGGAGGVSDDNGVGDIDLGFKYRLITGDGLDPQVAFLAGASVPTGQDGFSSGRVDPSFRLSLAHDLSERLSLGYNLGSSWLTEKDVGGVDDTRVEGLYTVALGISLTERVGVFAESFGSLALSDGGADQHSVDGGITLLLRNNLQLDLSGGFGINTGADDWFFGAGLAARLPR